MILKNNPKKVNEQELMEMLKNGSIDSFTINGFVYEKKNVVLDVETDILDLIDILRKNRNIDTPRIRLMYLDLQKYTNFNIDPNLKSYLKKFIYEYKQRFNIIELE